MPLAAALGLAVLAVNLAAVCPTFHWYDSAELVMAASTTGVPHQPGYPLYVILGKLAVTFFPFGEISWRLNVLSTVMAAVAAGLFFLTARSVFRCRPAAAAAGALLLSMASLFREVSLVAEVYTLEIVLLLAVTITALHPRRKVVFLSIMLAGFMISLRMTTMLYLVMLAVSAGLLKRLTRSWMSLGIAGLVFLIGLTPLFVTALRLPYETVLLDPLIPRTIATWLRTITARDFQPYFMVFSLPEILYRTKQLLILLFMSIGPIACLAALAGMQKLYRSQRPLFLFTLGSFVLNIGFLANFSTGEIHRMCLPALVMLSMWAVCGLQRLDDVLSKAVTRPVIRRGAITAGVIITLLYPAWEGYRLSYRNDISARSYGESVLKLAGPGGFILGDSNVSYRPPLFIQKMENRGSDRSLVVIDLFTDQVRKAIVKLKENHPEKLFFSPLMEPPGIAAGLLKHFHPVRYGPTCWLIPRWMHEANSPGLRRHTAASTFSGTCPFTLAPTVQLNGFSWKPAAARRGGLLELDYHWSLDSKPGQPVPETPLLLLRKAGSPVPVRRGLLVFHDVHTIGQWILPGSEKTTNGRRELRERTVLHIPHDLEPGAYEIIMGLGINATDTITGTDGLPLLQGRLWVPGVNPLSFQDYTQQFKLSYGQPGPYPLYEPLVSMPDADLTWHTLGALDIY